MPGDRQVTIAAWHPWLAPDPTQGSALVRGGREDLLLTLVSGDELRIPVSELNLSGHSIRIARYSSEVTSTPAE